MFQGQGNGAATGARVDYACGGRQKRQGPGHQGFGVGTRAKHTRINLQFHAVERRPAGDPGQGLARKAAPKRILPNLLGGDGKCFLVVRYQLCARLGCAAKCVQ